MTAISLDTDEKTLLEKGLKHNIKPKFNRKDGKTHLLDIENAILKTDFHHQDEIRTVFINQICKQSRKTRKNKKDESVTKTIRNLKKKITDNHVIVTKADKGNTTVLIHETDYNNKIEDYITNNNIQNMRNDPTKYYLKNINKTISLSHNILNKHQIHRSKMIKPVAPVLTGLPKLHKPEIPIRPLINFTTSPTYKIAKIMNKWLKENIFLKNNWSVKNNTELVSKIQTVTIPNGAKLASLDVSNMYTNIPIAETIKITNDLLIENKVDVEKVTEAIKLLTEITRQNYFQHNKTYYTQNDGLPMGSPLSGTLADIYLNFFEETYVHNNSNKYRNNLVYWYRYVDDFIILFRGTQRQLNNLYNYLNNINPKIKFTLENETNKSITFLDLTIKNIDGRHHFKIFRKITQTNHTIHNTSYHPFQHKTSAYNHMIRRLNNIPMNNTDYTDELKIIINIAEMNGFNQHTIHRLNTKIKSKMQQRNLTTLNINEQENKRYITIDYNEHTSNILHKILKSYGYNIAYKTNNKIQHKLRAQQQIEIDSGIYKLKCNDCPKYYIGQTGRTFLQRFNEHVHEADNALNATKCRSNFAQHLVSNKHTYTDFETNAQILHRLPKCNKMDRLEEFEIYQRRKDPLMLNDKINTKTNQIFDCIIQNKMSHYMN